MAGDAWLKQYESCSRHGQELMEMVNEKKVQERQGANTAKISSQIRNGIKQFSQDFNKLRQDLIRTANYISSRESEIRQAMLDKLATQEKRLQQAMSNDGPGSGRAGLLGPAQYGGASGLSHDPWQDNTANDMSIGEIRDQQQTMIKEQDDGLDALHQVVLRQKMMASDIGNELDVHNDLIDDITDHTDRTNERLIKETRHIKIVDKKSNTCCYWVVAILLFIAIVVIAVVPYNGKA
ncbi:syntaxin-8-like [Lineus longissimus]|uniref:syntaxin-8-like n=1 Tax=Lineus longissimus TaxID=88925 RepID=UPI002B4F7041